MVLTIAAFVVSIFVTSCYFKTTHRSKPAALVVIAHPDDECMFFSPCLQFLAVRNFELHCLCLTNGNYYGRGDVREIELVNSLSVFNFPRQNIYCLNSDSFFDDPHQNWNPSSVSESVLHHIRKIQNLKIVVTFDSLGVSGHSNHCDIRRAVSNLPAEIRKKIEFYELVTCSVARKYITVLDSLFALINLFLRRTDILIVAFPWIGYKAMLQHKSQLTWFRLLYIIFSKYMVINELKLIK